MFEEAIKRGQRTAGGENLFPVVHPDLDPDETMGKIWELRTFEAVELWEKVYSVWPETAE